MAISAQQSKISLVRLPIAEAATPRPTGFNFGFLCPVYVVNVQRAKIAKAANNTLAAEHLNDLNFALPVSRMLVARRPMLIPIGCLTVARTELCFARVSALATLAGAAPSGSKIAALAAIFPRAVFESVRVHSRDLAAMGAGYFYRLGALLSHAENVSQYQAKREPKYFDIACKRISEALKQPDMFIEKPKPAKQEAML